MGKSYSKQFKQEALALCEVEGMTVAAVARDLGISDGVLYRWRQEALRDGMTLAIDIQVFQLAGEEEVERLHVTTEDLKSALDQLPVPLAVGAASPLLIEIKGALTDAERTALLEGIRFVPGEAPIPEPPDWLYDVLPTEIDVTPDELAYVVIGETLCLPLGGEGRERRFIPVAPVDCWNTVYARFDHWHPGSRTSGWWADAAGLVAPGVFGVWNHQDEDGDFYYFESIDDRDPEAVADRLASFIEPGPYEGYECMQVLLAAYVHGVTGEVLQGVEVEIDLFTDENPGYCMTPRFDLPPAILDTLRRHEATAVGRDLASPGSAAHAQYLERLAADAGGLGEEHAARLRDALAETAS